MLEDRYIWVPGMGWLAWDGRRWERSDETDPIEAARQYAVDRFGQAADAFQAGTGTLEEVDGWRKTLQAHRLRAVLALAKGLVRHRAEELDSDPDLLNTPDGVVDLRTGEMSEPTPSLLMTKLTSGNYRPGLIHRDWAKALRALPRAERRWLQARIGQAITGHPTPDGVMAVLQGSGENGKSLLLTEGLVPALGDYAMPASSKLFQSTKTNEHSTERAELQGKRLLVAEELTEGRSIDVTALKQIQDVPVITARYIRENNFTFQASHSLFATTNYIPVINETDHGTWRRLALVVFPYTFRKAGEELRTSTDRHGDQRLKARIKANETGQHDAIVTWAIEGARRWYTEGPAALALTDRIKADTRAWRKDADRIMAAWDELWIPDPDACVLSSEWAKNFNEWLQAAGHQAWSTESFKQRFLQHEETRRHAVTYQVTRELDRLCRPPDIFGKDTDRAGRVKPVPAQARVYRGVRYRLENDTDGDEAGAGDGPVTGVTGSQVSQPARTYSGVTRKPVTPVTGDPEQGNLLAVVELRCSGCGEVRGMTIDRHNLPHRGCRFHGFWKPAEEVA